MIHSLMKEDFATRFTLYNSHILRKDTIKVLGVWVGEDPSCWAKSKKKIIKRAYAHMSLLTKLEYAGLSRQKNNKSLLFIDNCCVVWCKNLTIAQSNAIERIPIVALKIDLGQEGPKKKNGP